jgi:pyruvate,water dikinase
VRDRENLRFERTRVFGRARRIVLAMGERLTEAGRLDDPRDVFFLEVGELLGAVEGTATTADLRGLVRVRRAEFAAFAGEAPAERFRTEGAVALSPLLQTNKLEAAGEGERRVGLGCCPGVVEGPARVVRDPRGVTLALGTILVAERTDPGWVLLFPSCAGLVVERGSLLSHSAIVARELGIPAAVAVPGATGWLRDGDRVRLDGATGTVERLPPLDSPAEAAVDQPAHAAP